MIRRLYILVLAALLVTSLALAGETKEANGTVKSVSGNTFIVTDSNAKDWTFEASKDTLVLVKGGSHKMDKLKADGKPTTVGEFLAAKQDVIVTYWEKEGKMMVKEVRVK